MLLSQTVSPLPPVHYEGSNRASQCAQRARLPALPYSSNSLKNNRTRGGSRSQSTLGSDNACKTYSGSNNKSYLRSQSQPELRLESVVGPCLRSETTESRAHLHTRDPRLCNVLPEEKRWRSKLIKTKRGSNTVFSNALSMPCRSRSERSIARRPWPKWIGVRWIKIVYMVRQCTAWFQFMRQVQEA
jgi:hypothetical protein